MGRRLTREGIYIYIYRERERERERKRERERELICIVLLHKTLHSKAIIL